MNCCITSDTLAETIIPYISLGETDGVTTESVPFVDDGLSPPIRVQFPLGSQYQSEIYVR